MNNKKIKIIHITRDLDLGGLQQVIVNICRTIDRSRFNVSIHCLRKLGCYLPEVEKLGIPVTLITQNEHGTDYFSFLKIAHYFRKVNPDVIHTHNTQPFVEGTIAALMTGVKKIIHTDHARAFPDKRRYMFAEWLVSQFAYRVVGVSEHTSRNLIKFEHIQTSKTITIPNGIDPEPYRIVIDKKIKRRQLGIFEDGPIIGVAVRLSEQKGVTYLLEAMPDLIKQFPNISLVIAGEGKEKNNLYQKANVLNITNNVFFIGLRLDIPELLQLFNIYLLPSLWEGLPVIVLEAITSACPIIASDVGGVSTAITHGVNGFLVQPGNVEQLSKKITKAQENYKT